jgi:hypothetical protein
MTGSLQITAADPDPALLDLPWPLPLKSWPAHHLAALPRGISRHIVRFVKFPGSVLAIKEINDTLAHREYSLLRLLRRLGLPVVEPVGVVTGRYDPFGEPLESALITRHLQFSLPYRALYTHSLRSDTATRLIDALAVLLVRLHLAGFYWGDVSLSNTCSAATPAPRRLPGGRRDQAARHALHRPTQYDVELAQPARWQLMDSPRWLPRYTANPIE